jgi:hypothetical protein
MNYLKLAAIAVIALALGACASVSSRYGNSRSDQQGQAYYLPKGLMQVRVTESNGQFNVTLAGPIMVADAQFRFHADLRETALSDNNAIVTVDPRTQLLTSAEVTSTGQAGEIIENFYRVGQPYAGFDGGYYTVEIFSGLYEVSELDRASSDASQALMQYFERRCGENGDLAADSYGAEDCARYQALGIDQPDMVAITVEGATGASTANTNISKCGRGLCYRPLVPVKIRAVVAGTFVTEDYYMIPDTSTVSYYLLRSGFFATQQYSLTFDQGVLVAVDQKQQSELLGFSRIPVEILKAIVSVPVSAIRGNGGGDSDDGDAEGGSGDLTGEAGYNGGFEDGGEGGADAPKYFKSRTIQLGNPINSSEPAGFRGQRPAPNSAPGSNSSPGGFTGNPSQQAPGTSSSGDAPAVIIERVIEPQGQVQTAPQAAPVQPVGRPPRPAPVAPRTPN